MLRLLFLLVSQGPAIVPTAPHSPAGDPPVRLWLSSHGDYEHGDRAKVHAQAAQDGYLVVLHAAPLHHVAAADQRQHREAVGESLAERRQVRPHAVMRLRAATGPAEPRNHFVQHQQRPSAIAALPQPKRRALAPRVIDTRVPVES